MTTDFSLNYEFSTCKIEAQYMLSTKIGLSAKTKNNWMYTTCTELVDHNSMNNLLSYFGLVDSRMSASDIDLPVNNKLQSLIFTFFGQSKCISFPDTISGASDQGPISTTFCYVQA